ncbi:MAG: helicase-related protein [Alphaproteobacteria bacterium]
MTAILGPTNTGKTHFAMERLLAYSSGIMGFPLRLLARENYDRAVAAKGAHAVALITGEEKILPPHASYFLCTVESMPTDMDVDFVGVDEIQLAADPERGHIFTNRMLHARGRLETVLIGADTIRPLLRRLVPEAEIVERPRLSRLTYAGPKKITRLPSRSAVIGFSAAEVYGIAELMRRRRGGTAVVLGALSPRTRNAQVAMYQAGEVDYLVATDAIGMGLNMDINHVAFARLSKFDGRFNRPLAANEIGQIAGRAGRHMNDGTFGTTAGLPPLTPDLIDAVENHRFPLVKAIYWRNPEPDFANLDALMRSLTLPPPSPLLMSAREAEDHRALSLLARDEAVRAQATRPAAVELLWQVCQIPDFRKLLGDSHARLIARIFADLSRPKGRIDNDWLARHVEQLDRTDGDLGALMGRIADIRTWTYVSHHQQWLDDAPAWQERTRQIEDKLSDALHERLTQRFVDRRAAALVRRMRDQDDLQGAVNARGDVLVEGEHVGRLHGFRFVADASIGRDDAPAIRAAALRALRRSVEDKVTALAAAPDAQFALAPDGGSLLWHGEPIARLAAGAHPLTPQVDVLPTDLLEGEYRERVKLRLEAWLRRDLAQRFATLDEDAVPALKGAARGLVFQLRESLGSVTRRQVESLLASLDGVQRKALAKRGVRIGAHGVFVPQLATPPMVRLRALLWSVFTGASASNLDGRKGVAPVPAGMDSATCAALGFLRCGALAVKFDRAERLVAEARKLGAQGAFAPTPQLLQTVGATPEQFRTIMKALGYRFTADEAGGAFSARPSVPAPAWKKRQTRPRIHPCSPFAVLRQMNFTK